MQAKFLNLSTGGGTRLELWFEGYSSGKFVAFDLTEHSPVGDGKAILSNITPAEARAIADHLIFAANVAENGKKE